MSEPAQLPEAAPAGVEPPSDRLATSASPASAAAMSSRTRFALSTFGSIPPPLSVVGLRHGDQAAYPCHEARDAAQPARRSGSLAIAPWRLLGDFLGHQAPLGSSERQLRLGRRAGSAAARTRWRLYLGMGGRRTHLARPSAGGRRPRRAASVVGIDNDGLRRPLFATAVCHE